MFTRKHVFAGMVHVTIKQTNAGEMRFRITVVNSNDRALSISIHHGHDVLFEDLTVKSTYENVFNLSDLEDGDYIVFISSGKEKITRTLHIQTETKVDRQLTVE